MKNLINNDTKLFITQEDSKKKEGNTNNSCDNNYGSPNDQLIATDNDVFNLNNNISKFSYQNLKNEKELRELKL